MQRFADLQAGLGAVMRANSSSSRTPHVVVVLPSYAPSMSSPFLPADFASGPGAPRRRALEHRFLVSSLVTHRLPHASWLFVTSTPPAEATLGYLAGLGPDPDGFRARTRVVSLDDPSPRAVAAKLLDRPEVLESIQRYVGGRPAVIEPWTVGEAEVALAERLGMPLNGTDPQLAPVAHKSAGRRLFAAAGVPVPVGVEDIHTPRDVVTAIESVKRRQPAVASVVVKHDAGLAGEGNLVLPVRDRLGRALPDEEIRAGVLGLPRWFLGDLARDGGVVEELVTGDRVTSPSVQLELTPHEGAVVLATHEQELGGEHGQAFLGCRLPADEAYSASIARDAQRIGNLLLCRGATGRASVDFVAARDRRGRWQLSALEVDLRKGGTSHPFSVLRNLVPGRYDAHRAAWIADADGLPRSYLCTDAVHDSQWAGVPAAAVIDAVRTAGLGFDHRRGRGVVLHMLSALGADGRFGFTAIGGAPTETAGLAHRVRGVVERAVRAEAGHGARHGSVSAAVRLG